MERARIIYFFDPLCLTCFSFRKIISALVEKYPEYYFDVLSGGMVTGNRVGPLSQKSDYLLKKVAAIENTTDARFGDPYKEAVREGKIISDSEPPSIAFNVFKSFRPDLRFKLAHRIQDLHFLYGKDPNQMKNYFDFCEEFNVNKFAFMDRFQDPAYRQLTRGIFKQVGEWGISHFPQIAIDQDGVALVFQQGYDHFSTVEKSFLEAAAKAGLITDS